MSETNDGGAKRNDPHRIRLRRTLIAANIVYALLLAVAWFPAIFSPMYASGGTSLRVYIQVYSLLTFPFVLAFSMVVPWVFYRLSMARTAITLLVLPVINMVLILLFILLPAWTS